MQPKHFTLCMAALAVGGAASAQAPFVQADTLAQLPADVQRQLGVEDPDDPIADRGAPFNAGCVAGAQLPNRRFLLGAVSDDVVVVAIELGGIAHYSRTLAWRRQGERWLPFERRNALAFPKNLQELLQEVSPGRPQAVVLPG